MCLPGVTLTGSETAASAVGVAPRHCEVPSWLLHKAIKLLFCGEEGLDDDASVASGNKRHLAIIKIVVPIVTYKITFSLANFASIIFNQISFPIFYSLHELCATIGKTSILHK